MAAAAAAGAACAALVAMVMGMIVLPASAEEMTESPKVCPHCNTPWDACNWTPWVAEDTENTIPSGHYYLDGDYVQDSQKEIMAGDRVVLDLRGHTITSKSYDRLLLVYGRFHLLDTVGGGRFMSKTSGGAYGGVVMVSTNEVNDSLFELCSGTITPDADNKGSRRGGLIHVSATASFRMTGGMLLNGKAKGYGGNVCGWETSSVIEILGGSIIGGQASANWTGGGNIYTKGLSSSILISVFG